MFYYLKNLSSQVASKLDHPGKFKGKVPVSAMQSKAHFTEWCQRPTTENCHYSMVEGVDALRRVGIDNPPLLIHGIVADYDAKVKDSMLADILENCPSEHVPMCASSTFSGGARLLWKFESPLTVPNIDVAKRFLTHAASKLRLSKMLPGLDKRATTDPCKYYEVGTNWGAVLDGAEIPANTVYHWAYEAGAKAKWDAGGDVTIPMNILEREMERRFPNKWKGPFVEGARGPRFWDDMASNPTAAVIRPTGVQCFSGDEGFIPWRGVFGPKFVDQFEEQRTGEVCADSFYDGKQYWTKKPDGAHRPCNKDDFKLKLKVDHGLSGTTASGDNCSETDRVIFAVQEQKYVDAALPFVHHPEGMVYAPDGRTYLNTSRVKCTPPLEEGDKPLEWGEGFPWLAEFLGGFFDPVDQLDHFLAWWQRFYANALVEKPVSGQALFIAGDTGLGKTLLSTLIVSKSVGGHADASSFLLGEQTFTSHVVSSPIMTVDDTSPASDNRRHTRYSAMIKKITANRQCHYEQKFQQAGEVTWLGRVVVTCNLDPESIRLLPNVELSLLDKISLMKCATRDVDFPSDDEIETTVSQELPALLRWLLDWEAPEHCRGKSRFGVAAYHNHDLINSAVQTAPSYTFLELLADFLDERKQDPDVKDKTTWEAFDQ
mgnify:CR=1 FL=1